MSKSLQALRGATTIDRDERQQIVERVGELLAELVDRNDIVDEDWVSILFTVTDDICSAFPAEAARAYGLSDVPLMCAREIPVVDSTPLCIRLMAHVQTERPRRELRHVYLHGASALPATLPQ